MSARDMPASISIFSDELKNKMIWWKKIDTTRRFFDKHLYKNIYLSAVLNRRHTGWIFSENTTHLEPNSQIFTSQFFRGFVFILVHQKFCLFWLERKATNLQDGPRLPQIFEIFLLNLKILEHSFEHVAQKFILTASKNLWIK